MEARDVIISEGHRFTVTFVSGVSFSAEEEGTGRIRQGRQLQAHGGGLDVEWLDGDPNWHNNAPVPERPEPVAPPEPDPAEATRASRFDRDPFGDE